MKISAIKIRGACQNNLKGLDLDIPLHKITVVTGVSGSGKSSLAFDTLYAEGQRRYVETFSPYARQFMDRMDRPLVDRIQGIPPAIAIDRKDPVRTSRSTVGTMTEITDFVKLLFARRGQLSCGRCGRPVQAESPAHVWHRISGFPEGSELMITFPYPVAEGAGKQVIEALMQMGYDRYLDKGGIQTVDGWEGKKAGTLDLLADRVMLRGKEKKRIMDSLEQAFRMGSGTVDVRIDRKTHLPFSAHLACAGCNIAYSSPTPNLFSFNSPIGACETCRGFGRVIDVDLDLVIPDPSLTIDQGAVKPWRNPGKKDADVKAEFRDLLDFCRRAGIPVDMPFQNLSASQKKMIVNGTDDYYGIRGFFRWLESRSYKMHVRVFLSRYRSYDRCPDCQGARFKPETLLYRLDHLTIADIYALNVDRAAAVFDTLTLPDHDPASQMVCDEVRSRLGYLKDVGLGYLSLDRQSRTLSGGEVQRVALTSALGSSLVDTLYVLDEPSIGLHPRNSYRLIRILQRLRDLDNTVVVVEHDPEIIRESDYLLDLGPGAGDQGGEVLYFGPTAQVKDSLTGQYLKGQRRIPVPDIRRKPKPGRWLTIRGAAEHNLKSIDVRIPLGLLVCLTGVSGSGKSTLAEDIVYRAVKREKGASEGRPGRHRRIVGAHGIDDIVLVDQRPIGRTPRANALTYTRAMDSIRKLLAGTPAAVKQQMGPGRFSFNVPGGRCEACKGEGFERVEMQFLSDVFITCPVCNGQRFGKEALAIRYRDRNIHDILTLTVAAALTFFSDQPGILKALSPLADVGLGYIRLGQPVNTFSGGEAQRLKLSRFIDAGSGGRRMFIFDEPTTGLHFHDIAKLLQAFQRLVSAGNTVLVVEHNMEVIKAADWVIDMGPEGGDGGGAIVVAGTPEQVADCPDSHTGRFLRPHLEQRAMVEMPPEPVAGVAESPGGAFAPALTIRGAREHNLKNIDLTVPRNRLVVFTGVSGSGKSTLAFDILFAEGQRRYLESLAPYVRQYIRILERPDVDMVSGLAPTVAIEQRVSHSSRRSTVATLTEIYHYLRLLFSKLGKQHCTGCGLPLAAQSKQAIIEGIRKRKPGRSALVLAPKVAGRKGFHKPVLAGAVKKGFQQARIDGDIVVLTENMALDRYREHSIDVVVGRCSGPKWGPAPLDALVETALHEGDGSLVLLEADGSESVFTLKGVCPTCGIGLKPLDPRLFSFNSRQGACPVCNGLGTRREAAAPKDDGQSLPEICPACGGSRLSPEALAVKIGGHSIRDLVCVASGRLQTILENLRFNARQAPVADPVIQEVRARLSLLNRLGLGYLPLSRSGDTLSGGEAQRVRLAAQLGSNLTGVCYILDEPTIGLHPRDSGVLIGALKDLRDRGNTILVVEHDEDTIRAADTIIDLGPGAGGNGGEVVVAGGLADLKKNRASVTGACLVDGPHGMSSRLRPYRKQPGVTIRGARANNLRNLDVFFPARTLIAVTGVSGSGKSSLLKETLFKGLKQRIGETRPRAGSANCDRIDGWRIIDRVLEVDHSPIGRTPRSVPASYVGFLDTIRNLFAATPESRMRGYKPGRFSFNVSGGRCEVCKGQGLPKVAMNFLPDVYVPCKACHGTRFNSETLIVQYRGKNIGQVLDMTFAEALQLFSAVSAIRRPIQLVCDVGLGYLRLGQPSPTLSGGEAQRIKLAERLARSANGHTLYVLDEPTTGLHLADVQPLIQVLQTLVDMGNTIAVVEHNLELIRAADYVIDLGPEGGAAGGRLVASGSPRELVRKPGRSHTARHLKKYIEG